jgi:hypothetical protein
MHSTVNKSNERKLFRILAALTLPPRYILFTFFLYFHLHRVAKLNSQKNKIKYIASHNKTKAKQSKERE